MTRSTGERAGAYQLRYEPALDGLRAIAIVAVVLYHAAASSGRATWFRGGFIGVSVFFTLSGFLITSVLLRDYDQHGRVDTGRFWSRRIKRLIPAQMATIAAVVVAVWAGLVDAHRSDVTAAAWSVTNWHIIIAGPDRILQTAVGPLGPTWSLAIEEQFYLILMVAVLGVVAWAARPAQVLGYLAAAVIVGSIGAQFLVAGWNARAEFGLDTRAAELAVGVGLAALANTGVVKLAGRSSGPVERSAQQRRNHRPDDQPGDQLNGRLNGRLNGHGVYDAMAGAGVLFIIVGALTFSYEPPWLLRGGYTVVALVSAATIVGLVGGGAVAGALAAAPVVWIGRLSYSWYLVHWPVMLILSPDRTGLDGVVLIGLKVAVSLGAALAMSVVVENPIRRRATTRPAVAVAAWIASAVAITVVAWATLAA